MPVCLRSQPSCHASLKLAGYSNLLNGDTFKMSNLNLSQPGVTGIMSIDLNSYSGIGKSLFHLNWNGWSSEYSTS